VLRPLAGDDKEEIVELAKKIETFDISIVPYEDCCSLFVPKNPETKARSETVQKAEEGLQMDEFIRDALNRTEMKIFDESD
jgi:thiamine biosynthesis protein ThiI